MIPRVDGKNIEVKKKNACHGTLSIAKPSTQAVCTQRQHHPGTLEMFTTANSTIQTLWSQTASAAIIKRWHSCFHSRRKCGKFLKE